MTLKIEEKTIIRNNFLNNITKILEEQGEEVLNVGTNAIAIPTVYNGVETALKIVVSVPNGERGGNGWDCYFEAEQYKIESEEKRLKAEAKAKAKEEKIKKDTERREQARKEKEKRVE